MFEIRPGLFSGRSINSKDNQGKKEIHNFKLKLCHREVEKTFGRKKEPEIHNRSQKRYI